MANIKSSIKRIEIAERNRVTNKTRKSAINTYIRNFEKAIEAGEVETAEQALKVAERKLRQAEIKGIVHKNKINRIIGRMHRQYNQATA